MLHKIKIMQHEEDVGLCKMALILRTIQLMQVGDFSLIMTD
jgi:hypothetical protein